MPERIERNEPEGTATKKMVVPEGEVWFFNNHCLPSLGPTAYLPGASFFCPHKATIVKVAFRELVEIILAEQTLQGTMGLILERLAKKLTA